MKNNISSIHNPSFDAKELWKSFLNGDIDAYGKIFKYYYQDLYGYGLKLSQDPELVKDCIQEVFEVIGRSRSSLSEVNSIKAYLLVSLRRLLLKKIKAKRRHYRLLDEQDHFKAIQLSPEEFIINQEIDTKQKEALQEAIQSLPSRQKEILVLYHFNGMSYDEIEQILSINYQSIRNHIYRATKRLRSAMQQNEIPAYLSLVSSYSNNG